MDETKAIRETLDLAETRRQFGDSEDEAKGLAAARAALDALAVRLRAYEGAYAEIEEQHRSCAQQLVDAVAAHGRAERERDEARDERDLLRHDLEVCRATVEKNGEAYFMVCAERDEWKARAEERYRQQRADQNALSVFLNWATMPDGRLSLPSAPVIAILEHADALREKRDAAWNEALEAACTALDDPWPPDSEADEYRFVTGVIRSLRR